MRKDPLSAHWYAIRTSKESLTEDALKSDVIETYFPTKTVTIGNSKRINAIIPHVIFVKTYEATMLHLERLSKTEKSTLPAPIWVYRYPESREIQTIPAEQINILRLLTANDATHCEIFHKRDFKPGAMVEITGGPFEGLQGTVQRVKKNKHVIVKIEGICLVMLPYIHPDLLKEIDVSNHTLSFSSST